MALHEDFVDSAGLSLDSRSDKAVVQYSRNPNDEVYKLFQGQVSPLNTTKIASVCLTDQATVDLLLQEFFAQLNEAIKSSTVRLNLKIGTLLVKVGGFTQFIQAQNLSSVSKLGGDSSAASSSQ